MTDCHPKHHLTLMHIPLLSHLNRKLGPLMYEIKTNNCNFMHSFFAASHFHFHLSWSSVKWPHLSLWRVYHCLGLHSNSENKTNNNKNNNNKKTQNKNNHYTMSTCKQTLSFQCLWYPLPFLFTGTAAVIKCFTTADELSDTDRHGEVFTFKMFWIFTYSLSNHGAELCKNNCIQHYCLPVRATVHSCVHN